MHSGPLDARLPPVVTYVVTRLLLLEKTRNPTSVNADGASFYRVDLSGIEPLTPWLQTRCSPS
jgi:hypothetical protein